MDPTSAGGADGRRGAGPDRRTPDRAAIRRYSPRREGPRGARLRRRGAAHPRARSVSGDRAHPARAAPGRPCGSAFRGPRIQLVRGPRRCRVRRRVAAPPRDAPGRAATCSMKIAAVLGTRPEIIRLSRVIELLDRHCELVLVHTGQNFDPALSDVFFEELGVRAPDRHLGISGDGFAERVGGILAAAGPLFAELEADKLLVLGDTDSAMSAYVAKRMGIPVFHMEAGNRCFDDRVPEEVNRRLIDHASDVLMPYTERSRDNLLREGIAHDRVYVIGNPIKEV